MVHTGQLIEMELPAFFSISIFSLTSLKGQGSLRYHLDPQLQPLKKAYCCYVTNCLSSIRVRISFSLSPSTRQLLTHYLHPMSTKPSKIQLAGHFYQIPKALLNAIRLECCLRTAFSERKAVSNYSKTDTWRKKKTKFCLCCRKSCLPKMRVLDYKAVQAK